MVKICFKNQSFCLTINKSKCNVKVWRLFSSKNKRGSLGINIINNIPSKLEPPLFREDGKRADGVTLVPWSNGKILVWDATIRDTLAPSYIHSWSLAKGSVARLVVSSKCYDYKNIVADNLIFHSFAFGVRKLSTNFDKLGKILDLKE